MISKRSAPFLLIPLLLLGLLVAGCNGEDKPDPTVAEAQKKQRGTTRPGGAPPGFPVAGEGSGTTPGVAPGTAPRTR